MNKRKLLGLLCLMTLLATSCDEKGDGWGAMDASKTTLTLERICDMATLSPDSVELLSTKMNMNEEELYRTEVVLIGKMTTEEPGYHDAPLFRIAKDRKMQEDAREAYIRYEEDGTYYACLGQDEIPVGETLYCAMIDYTYGYHGRPGLLDHLLEEGVPGELFSEMKSFRLSTLPRIVVRNKNFTGYSYVLGAEVRSRVKSEILERGVCYSSVEKVPTINDRKLVALDTRTDYSSLEVEVTDLLPNTHYYIRPYAITKEGVSYGVLDDFTTDSGTRPEVSRFSLNLRNYTSVDLQASFYTHDYPITKYGYEYGVYSPETETITDGQIVDVPLGDDNGLSLHEVITGLQPGTSYGVRVYVENQIGITYSYLRVVEIPAE
ncbi:fibronectin type III domain-containing protein [Bacteroides fragilis]|nr:fibronectin type III domain-containing protein [Bacteroides fragilis]